MPGWRRTTARSRPQRRHKPGLARTAPFGKRIFSAWPHSPLARNALACSFVWIKGAASSRAAERSEARTRDPLAVPSSSAAGSSPWRNPWDPNFSHRPAVLINGSRLGAALPLGRDDVGGFAPPKIVLSPPETLPHNVLVLLRERSSRRCFAGKDRRLRRRANVACRPGRFRPRSPCGHYGRACWTST